MRNLILTAILITMPILVGAKSPSTSALINFATSPDKQLKLWTQANCQTTAVCKVYYNRNNRLAVAMALTPPFNEVPQVNWHKNLAEITTLSGTDTKLSVFIDAKRGVHQVVNMGQFDPIHECLLANDNKGKGLAFFRLFDNSPRQHLDLVGLNVDSHWVFPISGLVIGGNNKFLENGDFQFDYFTQNGLSQQIIIKNPCKTRF